MSARRSNLFGRRPYNGAAFPGDISPGGEVPVAVAQAPARPRAGGGRIFIIIGLVLALAGFGLAVLLGSVGGGHIGGGAPFPRRPLAFPAQDTNLPTPITTPDPGKGQTDPGPHKPPPPSPPPTPNPHKA